MKIRFIISLFCILIVAACVTTKPSAEKLLARKLLKAGEVIDKAETAIESENYQKALDSLLTVDSLSIYTPRIPLRIGICNFNLKEYSTALSYFNKTVNHKEQEWVPIDAYFYKGLSHYHLNEIDSALKQFDFLKDTLAKLGDKKFLETVETEIRRCETMMTLQKTPVTWLVSNLSDSVNSVFSDHSPVINGDESVLIFTSKRAGKSKVNKIDGTVSYYEDIFISHHKDSVWTKPVSISDSINTDDHEASIGLSADGQRLFIYKPEDKGSIFESELKGDVWTRPRKLGAHINSSHRETHASMSADGMYLYFCSDRPGGFGGMDIYVSKLQPDGTWGKESNLGYGVNTPLDEDGPFIHPNGTTLYFSSKGHNSIGGFDIFQTEKNQFDTWSRPQNLGYPVNTTDDDLFIVLSANGKRAYYASVNPANKKTDIYCGKMPDVKEVALTVMTGYITVPCGDLPYVNITINDLETEEIVGIYTPNSKTGKFIFFLNRGKEYTISVEANDTEVFLDTLSISDEARFEELFKTITVPPTKPCVDSLIVIQTDTVVEVVETKKITFSNDTDQYDEAIAIRNILFPSGKVVIPENGSLNQLADYLQNNPEAIVEVGGHSDSKGNEQANYKVALKRANAAKDYLIRKGVKPNQIKAKSYGPSLPISINQDDKGRYIPESMIFNRRVDFKVLKQGKKRLKILPVDQIPEKWRVKG